MAVHAELLYALVSPDGSRLYAEAATLEGIINASKQLREDGEDVDSMVVEKGGIFDSAVTGLVQEDWA